jgi:heterodisulfide reductase subunit A-like polyferredoxin
MLGADAVQLASIIQREGYQSICRIKNDLFDWLEKNDYSSSEEIKGAALGSLVPFEEIEPQPLTITARNTPCINNCTNCVRTCIYNAIQYDNKRGKIVLGTSLCTGCGACVEICPIDKLLLRWQ